jgi:branched-chain amino acid transport system substrate-binding protein
MNRKMLVVIGVVLIAIIVIAVVVYWQMLAPTSVVLKIGVPGPMSGPNAKSGQDMWRGAQVAVDEINEQGGLLGRNVTIIQADDESKPEVGVAALTRLITQDKVDAIVGGFHSSVTLAQMEVIAQHNVPYICVASLSPEIANKIRSHPQYKFMFKTEINATGVEITTAQFVKDLIDDGLLNITTGTYSIVAEDSDYGRAEAGDFKIYAKEFANLTCVSEEYIVPGTTDYYSAITKAVSQNPDFVWATFFGSDAVAFTKQYRELGVHKLLLGQGFTIFAEYVDLAGEAANGIIDVASGQKPDTTTKGKSFAEKYVAKFGMQPSYVSICQYDAMWVYFDAVKRANSLNPDTLVQALLGTSFQGSLIEKVVFYQDSHEAIWGKGYRLYQAIQVQDQKLYAVWPTAYAEKPIIIP